MYPGVGWSGMRGRLGLAVVWVALCGLSAAGPAQAAKTCGEPGASWDRTTPSEAGMDAAKLQDALDYGSSQTGFAVRVYRHGCLVGEDRLAAVNRDQQFESYSMAKSVTSLFFGRAMTLRDVSPDDPVGSLLPEADKPHGAITLRDLLTQTSGLEWNGFRDYNVFTMPDRVRDALTLGIAHAPGTYFEYAQSPVALLAEATGRSVGQDVQAFGQRELLDALGIPASAWRWTRDPAGHVQGFYGVNMRPDDYARLGDLLRRGGIWRGRRLLSKSYVQNAIAPTRTNGCYAWLIWVNAAAPCIGPTVSERPVELGRDFPDLPADMYEFAGLFGQRVTILPTQDIEIVRMGQDPSLVFGSGADWEHGLYVRVLGAVTDQRVEGPGDPPRVNDERKSEDYGFQTALLQPDKYSKGVDQDPLPPAGPARARAAQLEPGGARASRKGKVTVRLFCPRRWLSKVPAYCRGSAKLRGAKKAARYTVAPGKSKLLRFTLTKKRQRSLKRKKSLTLDVVALNSDAAAGTPTRLDVTVKRAKKPKRHKRNARR
jgi:CubicO group peptidase (beta-lactamase class C family)